MAFKLLDAIEARQGATILVDGNPCIVKSNDISKSGKHGSSKCRIEAISVIDGKKKVFVCGGHERLESPMIEKKRGQVLSISEGKASVMDLESFETLEMAIPEELNDVQESDQVEYWETQGHKIIKRKM